MTYFVEINQFKQMISYSPYVITKYEKKKVKYSLLDGIKESIGDKWTRFKEGTRQTFDLICFLSAELGFFYAGDEYLAERHDISDRTVRNRLKELEELGQVIKVHRRAARCNGRGKPIYLFVNHPYFHYWVELLGIQLEDFQTNFQTENQETSWESKGEGAENIPTYCLPSKQESNNTISDNKVVQFVMNRVNDSINKGTRIKYLSSYIDRMVRSLEWQALYAENRRQKAIKKQQEEENAKIFRELFGQKEKELPFYNWLE
jgi:DNA-binding Lrp family transcriptional regulator